MTVPPDSFAGNYASHPLWDAERDEPYLPLPGHPDLRLTPYRKGDDEAAIALGNDPVVTAVSFRRPVPYLPEHTSFIWETSHPACLRTIEAIRPLLAPSSSKSSPSSSSTPMSGADLVDPYYPMPVIRHHHSGLLVGDLALWPMAPAKEDPVLDKPVVDDEAHIVAAVPSAGGETLLKADGAKTASADGASGAKRPEAWEIGYTLSEPYRGKGVLKSAVRAVLEGWVKWTGIQKVVGMAQTTNPASLAVMRRNGFVLVKTYMQEWPADKGGGEREVNRLELIL